MFIRSQINSSHVAVTALAGAVLAAFSGGAVLMRVLVQARAKGLTSDEHFSVDGTLIEAWASLKSYRPRDDSDEAPTGGGHNPDRDFHGERRKNQTHASTTDPEAQLFRKGKGKEARLYYMGHVLSENRNGLVDDAVLSQPTGKAERERALTMIEALRGQHRVTLGADKNYDRASWLA